MEIGLVIYGSLDTISGGYLYDRKLVEYLRQRGDRVDIISIPWRNYPVHLTDNWNRRFYQQLKRFRGDILLQDELNHPSLFLLNRTLISRGEYPIVSIVHHLRASEQHPAWFMPLYRAVERAYLGSVNGFVFNSQTTKRAVAQLLGREMARCVVAPPAGDRVPIRMGEEEIRQRGSQAGPLRLLFVGNVIKRKGVHTILEALAQADFAWTLAVVGNLHIDRVYVKHLWKFVQAKGLQARVQFHGAIADDAVLALAKESHVFVMPSSYEGYGIAYLEGMGFGLPALGTTAGAAREIITDGKDGFLIQPEDASVLAEKLRILNGNRRLLVEMGLAARARYEAHPSWEVSMAGVWEFLARLMNKPGV